MFDSWRDSGRNLAPVFIVAALVGLAGWQQPVAAQWRFETTPFLWASGMDGSITVRQFTGDLDIGLGDLLDEVDGALMLPVEGRNGRWGIGFEIIYVNISDQEVGIRGVGMSDFQANNRIIELAPRYTVFSLGHTSLDVLAGGRYMRIDNSLFLVNDSFPSLTLLLNESYIEPLLGLRTRTAFRRWTFLAHGDVGGFNVGSEITWQALGWVGYRFSRQLTLRGGYRVLDIDFEEDDEAFRYDLAIKGLMIGASFSF